MINYKPIEKMHVSEQGSVVLKVENIDTHEICALKLVGQLSNKLNRLIFKREIGALRALNQFNDIVKIYDSSDTLIYNQKCDYGAILLEFVDGQSLDRIDFSSYSDLEKIVICKNIAKAILHAHQCGVLHRDIKPSNIMLVDGISKVKVIDFGNSKLKTVVDEETTKWVYSTGYVAPEVAQGQEATEKSDIYSLGAVFYYIFFAAPPANVGCLSENLNSFAIIPAVQSLLMQMLSEKVEERFDDVQQIVEILDEVIGCLNANNSTFWFTVDTEKLTSLKRQFTVESIMTFSQFLSTYLVNEFSTMYGIYNSKYDLYEFVGNELYMSCLYKKDIRAFSVIKLYSIPIDKRTKLQRIFGIIEGKKCFSGFGFPISGKNDSNRLEVQLRNYDNERQTLESKNNLFEELFGKWRQSILEEFEKLKEKSIQVSYTDHWFDGNRIYLSIDNIQGVDIDDLSPEIKFVFDTPENPKERCIPIGSFEDVVFEDDKTILILTLERGITSGKLWPFLKIKKTIIEDYRRKSVALRRQLSAIKALKSEEYNSPGLKDIILELSAPTMTHSITSLHYFNKNLNDSQRQAVIKAMDSNSISLIQGPPGTGKTSVISEIVQQILSKSSPSDIPPKILVVSQSNTAVDNILEGIFSWNSGEKIRVVRIGDKTKVSKDVATNYLVDAIKDKLFENVHNLSTQFVKDKLAVYTVLESDDQRIQESKISNLTVWRKAEEIQEDWLKRCGDYNALRYQIINSSAIIAGTCVGFLSDENVRDMIFDYVIVDEAAKATTPELLVSIVKANKIVLVGDQNQLPPFADGSLSQLSTSLVKDPQYRLFDILFDSLPETHKQFLSTQYRMCSTIGNLISTVFYDGKIITGINDEDRKHGVPDFEGFSIVWIDTSKLKRHDSQKEAGGSSYNLTEVGIVRTLLEKMNSQSNAKDLDVGIITAYRAQKEALLKVYKNGDYKAIGNIDINTLDAFQGRENDIIIYSTVRTNGSIGFQREKERINVAFSRAKCLLIVCGDIDFFETWSDGENKYVDVINYIRNNSRTCKIMDAREVIQ
ncbi:serine/threonine-protein kinase [Caproicibacterium amylolyticum]|uniref:Protein kinase n=1 Tax=Caproicibacterium amylolyticum TaxID=2766537 RepID=A0A7G9WGN0_9FIRM|nr:serine/threonine-protein kinase [Caproicibacterium amylolyticum]QNO17842.1 protein kinase [Caproicibacterium amylolyticum]